MNFKASINEGSIEEQTLLTFLKLEEEKKQAIKILLENYEQHDFVSFNDFVHKIQVGEG